MTLLDHPWVHEGTTWRNLHTGATTTLTPPPDPDPDPGPGPDPEPATPATILHGSELPATSDLAEAMIGAAPDLPLYTGPTDITAAMGPVVIENVTIYEKNVRVRAGANLTLRNVLLIGPYGSTTYTLRMNEGGGARCLVEDSTIVCRASEGGTYPVSGWGDTSLCLRRTVIRGGLDGVHYHGKGPAIWETGDPLIPYATFLMEECWLGENERLPGSHSDLMQMAGSRPNNITNYVWRRNRFMAYSIPMYADTLTTRVDPDAPDAQFASACWIDSTGGKGYEGGGSGYAVRDNWFEGGNNMFAAGDWDCSPAAFTGNRFAPRANFAAATGIGNWETHDNRWAYSGTLKNGTVCVGGELIPGTNE